MYVINRLSTANVEYNIESPLEHSHDCHLVEGWIFIPDTITGYLELHSEEKRSILPLNALRDDVVSHFSKKNRTTNRMCGFSYNINSFDVITLFAKDSSGSAFKLAEIFSAEFHLSQRKFSHTPDSEFRSRIKFREANQFHFYGLIGEIKDVLLGYDYFKAFDCISKCIESNKIVHVNHPLIKNVMTSAKFSKQMGMVNFIYYSSEEDSYGWFLVQLENFIDALIFPDAFFSTFSNKNNEIILNHFYSLLENNPNIFPGRAPLTQARFLVSNSRPFHFIYDQLSNYYNLPQNIKSHVEFSKNSFFLFKDQIVHDYKEDTFCYYLLTCIGLNYLTRKFSFINDNIYASMESYLLKELANDFSEEKKSISKKSNLNFWFGITGQKRALINQISCCENILTQLSKYFSNITVYIDGWTAPNAALSNDIDDLFVALTLTERIGSKANVVNLIGLDYSEKIKHAANVDCFVANAGSGAIVPLRLSKAIGVLHSNSHLNSFPSLNPSNAIYCFSSKENEFPTDGSGMTTNYHIDWHEIYNSLLLLFKDSKFSPLSNIDMVVSKSEYDEQNSTDKPTYSGDNPLDFFSELYRNKNYGILYYELLVYLRANPNCSFSKKMLHNVRLALDNAYYNYVLRCSGEGLFSKAILSFTDPQLFK